MEGLVSLIFCLALVYSFINAPDLFFRLFEFSDSPNYAFAYIVCCIVFGLTGAGFVYGVIGLFTDKLEPK